MTNTISAAVKSVSSQASRARVCEQAGQNVTLKRSFESVLRGDREGLPGTFPKGSALRSEFFNTRAQLGLLRETINEIIPAPKKTDLRNRFLQIEDEWRQLESMIESHGDLSAGGLLALQARLYEVSQHVEVLSKVVDQVTGGIKTVLNTNV